MTYAAALVAIAAAGVGTGFGVSAAGRDAALNQGLDPVTNVYAGTRQSALDARREALFANVAFGVAGAAAVAAVVGAVLVPAEPARLEVAPVASAGGAGNGVTPPESAATIVSDPVAATTIRLPSGDHDGYPRPGARLCAFQTSRSAR